jgi:hypothetical protein
VKARNALASSGVKPLIHKPATTKITLAATTKITSLSRKSHIAAIRYFMRTLEQFIEPVHRGMAVLGSAVRVFPRSNCWRMANVICTFCNQIEVGMAVHAQGMRGYRTISINNSRAS